MCETKRYRGREGVGMCERLRGREGEGMCVRLRDTEEERERECM